jgi:hypothetical protein
MIAGGLVTWHLETFRASFLLCVRVTAAPLSWADCVLPTPGMVELIVNAMVDVRLGFIDWEWH